jgi:putative transposase
MPVVPPYPRRHHPRLAGFDYHTPGYYFITICIHQRLPLFGAVEHGRVHLTSAGKMAQEVWSDVVALHPGVTIDNAIVMPDHVHAIVVLEDNPHRLFSLSDVVQRYKSLTAKRYAHGVRHDGWQPYAGRLWQESFYDHVIRTDENLDTIRRYIVENPMRWELKRAAAEREGGTGPSR